MAAQGAAREERRPTDDGSPQNVTITFGKHKDKKLGEVPSGYLDWLVANFEAKSPEQRRILMAAEAMVKGENFVIPDDDIPF
jgi:uncharacterized protein (DUF3820 family)